MFIEFDKDYLRELFEQGRTSDKKHRYQPEVIKGYQKAVASLKRAINVEMLYRLNFQGIFGGYGAFAVYNLVKHGIWNAYRLGEFPLWKPSCL